MRLAVENDTSWSRNIAVYNGEVLIQVYRNNLRHPRDRENAKTILDSWERAIRPVIKTLHGL